MSASTIVEESAISEENSAANPVTFKATRNYTGPEEQYEWYHRYTSPWAKDYKYFHNQSVSPPKQTFRQRRFRYCPKKALRIEFENNNEVGAFIKLTSSYCLVGTEEGSGIFYNTVKGDLPELPIIRTSLVGCRVVGRMCVGNKNGLLLPETVYATELEEIKNELPDPVKIKTIEDRLSALGNVIACNDNVAIIHPDLDKETEEIIADTLQVEVFRNVIGNNPLVGSYCVLNNQGGLVSTDVNNTQLENLSSLLQVPLTTGTVNSGCKAIASGLAVNDSIAYAGMKTTSNEFSAIESIFKLC